MKHARITATAVAALIVLAGCAPSELDGPVADPAPTYDAPTPHGDPGPSGPTAEPEPAPAPADWQLGTDVEVVDGDTLKATVQGERVTVRVLGIDTPETKHPTVGVECYGPEAAAEAALILNGNDVHLIADPTQDDVDAYGRQLRYVEMAYGGGDFGLYMIEGGFAETYVFDLPGARTAQYAAAEDLARATLVGQWGACEQ